MQSSDSKALKHTRKAIEKALGNQMIPKRQNDVLHGVLDIGNEILLPKDFTVEGYVYYSDKNRKPDDYLKVEIDAD